MLQRRTGPVEHRLHNCPCGHLTYVCITPPLPPPPSPPPPPPPFPCPSFGLFVGLCLNLFESMSVCFSFHQSSSLTCTFVCLHIVLYLYLRLFSNMGDKTHPFTISLYDTL